MPELYKKHKMKEFLTGFSGIVKEIGLSTYSIFESIRAYEGEIFELDLHLERFYESAKTIMLNIPRTKNQLKIEISHALKISRLKDAYIRITAVGENENTAKIKIIVRKVKFYPEDFYQKGVGIISVVVKRDFINTLVPNIKSANFLTGILAKIEANSHRRAFEALLLNHKGYVTEGTVSNIFIVRDKRLLTPALSCGALGGITRRVVIDLAKNLGIRVEETIITRYCIYTACEAFLTNTSVEIMPVVCCDGRAIGGGMPGEITRRLMVKFKERVRKEK